MEIWKKIKNFENYSVSSYGRIRNDVKFKILKQCNRGNGYNCVHLYNNDRGETLNVHKLVASEFIPNQDNSKIVHHKNGIKPDNRVYNLERATPSQHSIYSTDKFKYLDLTPKKVRCKQTNIVYTSSYKAAEWVDKIRFKGTKPIKVIASNIRKVCNNLHKTAYGYMWEFTNK